MAGRRGRPVSPELAGVGLGVALSQPDVTLTDERLRGLLDLARRLAAAGPVAASGAAAGRPGVRAITQGEPAAPVRLASPAAETARDRGPRACWTTRHAARAAGDRWLDRRLGGRCCPSTRLERYGRTASDPPRPRNWPAACGATRPSGAVCSPAEGRAARGDQALLGGPVGTRLRREDLAGHPELTELWLLQSVARGSMRPLDALDEIMDIRAAAERSPRVDAAMLRLLWPGDCPPDQLAELLGILADTHPPDVDDWFAAEVSAAVASRATGSGWLVLSEALADHPILAMLPEAESRSVRDMARVQPLLQRAQLDGPRGDADVFAELFGEYLSADADTRRLLDGRLPELLARASPLAPALRGCPDEVAAAFCEQLHDWLAPTRADIRLARRVFSASRHPDLTAPGHAASTALRDRLLDAFEMVRQWNRRDLGELAQTMDNDAELAQAFRKWRKPRRDELTRKFLGRAGPPAQET